MKHPAAAAGVLALHLLGLWMLAAARPPAPPDATARRSVQSAVLLVRLRDEFRPAAATLPKTRHTAAASSVQTAFQPPAPAPARAPLPGPAPALALAASPAAASASAEPEAALAPAALFAGTAAPATQATSPTSPPPAAAAGAPALIAAAAPEPALTLAHADRRDCPPAPHPAALRERGIEGEVRLLVRVGIDGRVAEVRLQQPSGWRLFDHAAQAQALACRFVPARRGAQAVESWVEFPVRFSLRG